MKLSTSEEVVSSPVGSNVRESVKKSESVSFSQHRHSDSVFSHQILGRALHVLIFRCSRCRCQRVVEFSLAFQCRKERNR